jgi:hypothetical protein
MRLRQRKRVRRPAPAGYRRGQRPADLERAVGLRRRRPEPGVAQQCDARYAGRSALAPDRAERLVRADSDSVFSAGRRWDCALSRRIAYWAHDDAIGPGAQHTARPPPCETASQPIDRSQWRWTANQYRPSIVHAPEAAQSTWNESGLLGTELHIQRRPLALNVQHKSVTLNPTRPVLPGPDRRKGSAAVPSSATGEDGRRDNAVPRL